MKQDRTTETYCRLCEHAVWLEDSEYCLCEKKGVVFSTGHCRRFRADLLKFSPETRVNISGSDLTPLEF